MTEENGPIEGQFSMSQLPADGSIAGRSAFAELIPLFLEEAATKGWSRLCMLDPDFLDWPLADRRTYEALQSWSQKGRRMILHARSFDGLMGNHHRFVSWRRQWAHIVECWQCPQCDASDFPSMICSPAWSLRRIDRERNVCVVSTSSENLLALEELRQYWQEKSSAGFPAHVLGL